ncbi:hypothetical protein IGI67_005159 [Enterococcus sp. AZ196]
MALELLALKIKAISNFPIMIIFGLILILSGFYVLYFSQYSFKLVNKTID